eukprot:3756777-Alexandrium_andersonii.AAC.1
MTSLRSLNSRTCELGSGLQNLNCAGPGTASKLISVAPDGVRSARLFTLTPNLTTEGAVREFPRG